MVFATFSIVFDGIVSVFVALLIDSGAALAKFRGAVDSGLDLADFLMAISSQISVPPINILL
jgi:hypothetical protein